MSKFDSDALVGLVGFAVGMIGIGYAIGVNSKVAKIGKKLDKTIDELADDTPIEVNDIVVNRAVEHAVEKEVVRAVNRTVYSEIHNQVKNVVENEYSTIKNTVLSETVNAAAKIDVNRVKSDVEKAAKEQALKKFDDNLDSIVGDFKSNLENVTKIYKTFADAATPTRDRETILRIV